MHDLDEDEELAAREIRKCYYKNYKIYFFIDERIRTVYVLRVLHMLVNAKPLLLNMRFWSLYQSVKNIIPDNEVFTLDDGERKDRMILSGIHEYYESEELVGKTAIAIVNLPSRKMMGIDFEGMLISAVHEEDGHEGLNLLMVDDKIPAGAKLY